MKHDGDLLRRSMDAEPAAWLDRLVTERVVARVQRERATHPAPEPARPRLEQRRPWRAWLARLVPHGVQLLLWRSGGQRG